MTDEKCAVCQIYKIQMNFLFLGPETDRIYQFQGPEIVEMGQQIFWAQKLTLLVSFLAQKLTEYVNFWAQKLKV